jgi:hypothetical protein
MPDFREGNCMSFRIAGAALCGGLLIAMTTSGFAASNKKPPKAAGGIARGTLTVHKGGGDRPGFFYVPCSGCDPLSPKMKQPGGARSGKLTVRKADKRSYLSAGRRRNGGPPERSGIYAVHPTAANR